MKKSNKLLLAGFTIGLVLIAAIHITLYAKYKNGNYTIYHEEDDMAPNSMQLFPNILFISIRNVPYATVRFTDVAQVPKGQEETIDYVRKGDTLLIRGKDSVRQRSPDNPILFNVPYGASMTVYNSSLSFKGGKQINEINPVMYLQKGRIMFSGRDIPFQLGHLKVTAADSSAILFLDKTNVNQIEAWLSNSAFEYGDGNLGQLSIDTDSLSRIALPSKYLMKANIKVRQ